MSTIEKSSTTERPDAGNKTVSRRDFLKLIPPALLAVFLNGRNSASAQAAPTMLGINLSGTNLKGWKWELGDALCPPLIPPEPPAPPRCPGEAPVDITDIKTVHRDYYSELRANIKRRVIMAHNVTYRRIISEKMLLYSHVCVYQFRLPYLPRPVVTDLWNAQTLEGGLFVWDGANTRLDYGTAFQWDINPWRSEFGDIRTWTANGGPGQWVKVGHLKPDTRWHGVKMVVNMPLQTAALLVDGIQYPAEFSKTSKPDSWGPEVAARLQAEIISIDPEPSGQRAAHKARFRNWKWGAKPIT